MDGSCIWTGQWCCMWHDIARAHVLTWLLNRWFTKLQWLGAPKVVDTQTAVKAQRGIMVGMIRHTALPNMHKAAPNACCKLHMWHPNVGSRHSYQYRKEHRTSRFSGTTEQPLASGSYFGTMLVLGLTLGYFPAHKMLCHDLASMEASQAAQAP